MVHHIWWVKYYLIAKQLYHVKIVTIFFRAGVPQQKLVHFRDL